MDMFQIAVCAVMAALLGALLRMFRDEYRIYVVLAAGILFFGLMLDKLSYFVESLKVIEQFASIDSVYMECIIKMLGITCIAEFSENLCRDSGHEALAQQVSMLAKVSILCFSMPIMRAILETIQGFL